MPNPEYKIFYSWQSDLPDAINRNFIEQALQIAVKAIEDSSDPKLTIKIEQDARGKAGSPDLAAEIFRKIENASIFVGDVSIIGQIERRSVPNPNVMIEHGYALKALGPESVIAVFNTWKGKPESLPFDIRHRRVLTFQLKPGTKNVDEIKTELARQLETDLREMLSKIVVAEQAESDLEESAQKFIEGVATKQVAFEKLSERLWSQYIEVLDALNPAKSGHFSNDDLFIEALTASRDAQMSMYKIFDQIASYASKEALEAWTYHLGKLVDKYRFKGAGSFFDTDFDFYKFLGHELVTSAASLLLKYRRWDLLNVFLNSKFLVSNTYQGTPEMMGIDSLNEHVKILAMRKDRLKLDRISLHADLLEQRHSDGTPLGTLLQSPDFRSGDFLIYLWANAFPSNNFRWAPWSSLYFFKGLPQFVVEATVKAKAEPLMRLLGKIGEEQFRIFFRETSDKLERIWGFSWNNPFSNFNFDKLGTL